MNNLFEEKDALCTQSSDVDGTAGNSPVKDWIVVIAVAVFIG